MDGAGAGGTLATVAAYSSIDFFLLRECPSLPASDFKAREVLLSFLSGAEKLSTCNR